MVIQVTFSGRPPTVRGIKLITTASGFAATQRQTVELETFKKLVNFGVAAPRP